MNLAKAVNSSVGRKLITGLTGLLLVGFVIGHLTGNLLLFAGPKAFNEYAYFLETMFHGAGIIVAEIGLILLFGFHAWSGISVWRNKAKARPQAYQVKENAGGTSRKTLSSTTMLWTGLLLLAFVVIHVAQFKLGVIDPVADRMVTVDGVEMKNLFGRVVDAFAQPLTAVFYMVVMAMLGLHLWHGAWSAFQSLGLANSSYLPTIEKAAHAIAVLLAVGFLFLPGVIFVANDHFQKQNAAFVSEYSAAVYDQGSSDRANLGG